MRIHDGEHVPATGDSQVAAGRPRTVAIIPVRGAGQDLAGGHQAVHLTKLVGALLGDNPDNSVVMLAGRDYERLELKVLACDYPVVLAQSKEMAEAAANQLQAAGPVQVSADSGIAAGAGATAVSLPAGATLQSINIATVVGGGSTNTTVVVTGTQAGTLTYSYISPGSAIPYWPNPVPAGGLAAASPSTAITVTFNGVTNTGAGQIVITGTSPAANTSQPIGSYLPAGVDRTIRSCDELWAAGISQYAGRVSVIISRRLGEQAASP